jgi:tetratricopeptide (TPR) repeat protein
MTKTKETPAKRSGQRPSRNELRASVMWPIIISVGIWLAALVIWLIAPGRFDVLVSGIIALGLVIYLAYFIRSQRLTRSEQYSVLLLSIPAIAGITFGMFYGSAVYAITGVSLTLLLLAARRLFTTPFSYRMARRRFFAGDMSMALDLADKSIAARPNFWETYQLRALIYLSNMRFDLAERDAKRALELRPDAHPAYNTLGQLYLATNRFSEARGAYLKATEMAPQNALYLYHLGLTNYRLDSYRDAAEAFAGATRAGVPYVTYELLTYYYLLRSLEANNETEKAEEVAADLLKFQEGLPQIKADLAQQPDFPHLALLKKDVRDLEKRLAETGAAQAG